MNIIKRKLSNFIFSLFMGFRYFRSKKRGTIITVISGIAIVVASLSVMVPTIVISVVNGFHEEIKQRHLEKGFHIQLRWGDFVKRNGALIVSIANPDNPIRLSNFLTNKKEVDIIVKDTIAYLAHENNLTLVDLSNPEAPVVVGFVYIRSTIQEIELKDKWVYVATQGGLVTIDVQEKEYPKILGGYDLLGDGYGMDWVGDNLLLYGEYGITLLDVDHPEEPVLISNAYFDVSFYHGTVIHNTGFFSTDQELVLVDVSKPNTPIKMGEVSIEQPIIQLEGNQPFLYIQVNHHLLIFKMSSNRSIQYISGIYVDSEYFDFEISNHQLIIASVSGIHIYDTTNKSQPVKISYLNAFSDPSTIGLGNGYVLVGNVNNLIEDLYAQDSRIQRIIPFCMDAGLVKRFNVWQGVQFMGLHPSMETHSSFNRLFQTVAGEMDLQGQNKIFIGNDMANLFPNLIEEVERGGTVIIKAIANIGGREDEFEPNIQNFIVSGVFKSGYPEYDKNVVFLSNESMLSLFQKYQVDGLGITLTDREAVSEVESNIRSFLGETRYSIFNWKQLNAHLFYAFEWEKNVITAVLFIMIIASFLTIYLTLNVVVMDKRLELGIMKGFGISNSVIQWIFIFEGFLIGMIGVIIGLSLCYLIVYSLDNLVHVWDWVVNSFQWLVYHGPFGDWIYPDGLPEQTSILESAILASDKVPYQLSFEDHLLLSTGALLVSMLAAYFPARRATREKPLDILRFE